jgi:predicted  nucleic acid-binding Zn-ribbon protein
LVQSQSELDVALREKAEIKTALEDHSDHLERSAQLESDASRTCAQIGKTLRHLLAVARDPEALPEDEDANSGADLSFDLQTALGRISRDVRTLNELSLVNAKAKQSLSAENSLLRQTIADLETRIQVLNQEKSVADECNARYDKERKALTTANSTWRSALDDMKVSLVAAEDEKKRLKSEIVRLKLELKSGAPLSAEASDLT